MSGDETRLIEGIVLMIYFLPTIVVVMREHQHKFPVALLNLFLGWTFIGWVVALVWAAMPVKATAK